MVFLECLGLHVFSDAYTLQIPLFQKMRKLFKKPLKNSYFKFYWENDPLKQQQIKSTNRRSSLMLEISKALKQLLLHVLIQTRL